MSLLLKIAFSFIIVCTLWASVRLALEGFVRFPETGLFGRFLRFITARVWCLSLFLLLPGLAGEFARGGVSYLPWSEFATVSSKYGSLFRVLAACTVFIVDLWFFWVPANWWIIENPDIDKTKRVMVRIINLLAGLLLTMKANPIYRILESFAKH